MAKNLDGCPCGGATLDKLVQPAILTVLAAEPLHGYCIVERMADLRIWRGHKPDPTGVYRTLKAMQARGLVDAAWDAPQAGPAKRLFSLTSDGRRCMALWVATLDDYRDGIAEIVMHLRDVARARPGGNPSDGKRLGGKRLDGKGPAAGDCGCKSGRKTGRAKS
jgi:PadR family transcriptional regulator, regulatory protein PadR